MCNFNAFNLDQESLSANGAMSKEKFLGFSVRSLVCSRELGQTDL